MPANNAASADNGNKAVVTIAILGEKLEGLKCDIQEFNNLLREHITHSEDRERRVVILETKMIDIDRFKNALISGALALIGFLIAVVVILIRVKLP